MRSRMKTRGLWAVAVVGLEVLVVWGYFAVVGVGQSARPWCWLCWSA